MSAYPYTKLEKIGLAFPCLRQKLFPRRVLIAGPYAGEFGPELMQWQGYVRARRQRYRETHVITFPGRDYLYEGCTLHYHDIPLQKAGYWYGLLSPREARAMADAKARELGLKDYDVFTPALLCSRYHKWLFWRQQWRLFEEPAEERHRSDVLFHFRAVVKAGSDTAPKSYTPERADELVALLSNAGMRVACIGHPDYSYVPAGVQDLRSLDLRETIRALSATRLFVGGMSGPVHLACLAGKPILTWGAEDAPAYARRWNPFAVPLETVSLTDWQPAPAEVSRHAQQMYREIAARTDDFRRPCYVLPPQRIALA
jgi:hypothetical protein